jgi:molecular chaperone DnaJ
MNTTEACNILGIKPGASEEEISKAFRKKAAKLHPDKNIERDTTEDFKRVNEAHQYLKQHGSSVQNPWRSPVEDFDFSPFRRVDGGSFDPFRDIFMGGTFRRAAQATSIKASVDLTFEESVLGCTKEVTINRRDRCKICSGEGQIPSKNTKPCAMCEGSGERVIFGIKRPCQTCLGKGEVKTPEQCPNCHGSGGLPADHVLTVSIPPGSENGSKIRLGRQGDFSFGLGQLDAFLTVNVTPDKELTRDGDDVISILEISLLEALKGTSKVVRTVKGEKTLRIQPGVKNKDPIRVSGFGVPPNGNHIFILNVKYPQDIGPLIELLETSKDEPLEEIEGE